MAFITITDNGLDINDSDWREQTLIEGFQTLIKTRGFNDERLSCGVSPSPDFGYFQLADRFWRGSLAIYFSGVTRCFWERGAGYPEPWLFNARHSVELYLKGFLLYSVWFQELHSDILATGNRIHFSDLKEYIKKPHYLCELYNNYQNRLKDITNQWNTKELSECPDMNEMTLSTAAENILKEIDEADKTSFRFRYPSIKRNQKDHLQELNWQYDDSQLLPKTGLPKDAGFFFDHLTVINSLHKLLQEIKAIESYLGGCWGYIGEIQDIALDLKREFQEFYSE